MTVRELHEFSIERGLERAPRGRDALAQQMVDARAEYEALDGVAKRVFDAERLTNPFGDTRIACGDDATEVNRLICGVNITGSEILLADNLRHHGKPVDLVVAHHTSAIGGGLGSVRDAVWPQVKMLTNFGVPAYKAEKLVRPTCEGDQRAVGYNITQIAEALDMPLMTIHSPADLYMFEEGTRTIQEDQPQTVGDLLDISDSWPEVQQLIDRGKGTEIVVGDRRDPLGKTYYAFYGGWNPTPQVFEALCDAGCGTLWVVATSEELNQVARARNASIVVVPHFPADNLGLNMLFDDAMDHFGDFDIVETSDYRRYDRRAD